MRGREWDVLLRISAKSLPISVNEVCRSFGILTLSYKKGKALISENNLSKYTFNDAFSTKIQGRFVIFYNDNKKIPRKREAIMHEVGHILCGHMVTESVVYDGIATLWNKQSEYERNMVESAANDFASAVFAPACVLWGLKITKPKDIQKLCGITAYSAKRRANRMSYLYSTEQYYLAKKGRTCFLLSPREKDVYKNFKDFIAEKAPKYKRFFSHWNL